MKLKDIMKLGYLSLVYKRSNSIIFNVYLFSMHLNMMNEKLTSTVKKNQLIATFEKKMSVCFM